MPHRFVLLVITCGLLFLAGRDSLTIELSIAEIPDGVDPDLVRNPKGSIFAEDFAGMTPLGWGYATVGTFFGVLLLRPRKPADVNAVDLSQ